MPDFKSIEQKWIKKWADSKIFQPEIDKTKKKFFCTFPYPYINAYPHLGHFYTIMRVEAFARYKRMQGYNVLFPQGWHATGSPIISATKRVKEKEPKQLKIMKDMGFSDKDLKKFEKPEAWVDYFVPEFRKDFTEMGLSIDWRREFFTTSLNPHYDKFIRWQFTKLKEKNYVVKGKFPVVWDPINKCPVGDHDRVSGEGETAQEFVLLKFKFGNEYIIAATLRPETVYGQTNLWVGPKIEYVKAEVGKEIWIISEPCAEKLKGQERNVKIKGKVIGEDLIGRKATAPGVEREIPILPAYFCEPDKGTGIVTSVPSDAPDDWIGLVDLQKDEKEIKKFNLDANEIKAIKPIAIIDAPGLGDMAAIKICEEMKIHSQHEREKLLEAKKIVYKKGFYEGTMNKSCGKYAGMPVRLAKDKVRDELVKNKKAELFYELTGKVVSRSLHECIVKIVDDQWFIAYGDEEWKKKAHKAFEKIKLYPEKSRQQFDYVIDWLHNWACTREEGLGTRLPWDEKWLIESLSDSTIYMAYYTIVHILKNIPIGEVNNELFDYVFLGKGKAKSEIWKKMRDEFEYWYPLDFRNSGKDLIQNHLTFFVFNHCAIFDEKYWPKGIGTNGWVLVDGQKMSKSLGNFILLRDIPGKYGVDPARLTILSGGEDMDDPNWETEFAESIGNRLLQMQRFCIENYNTDNTGGNENELGRLNRLIDKWFESRLNKLILGATQHMEETYFRSAIKHGFFELQNAIKWYMRRCQKPNKKLLSRAIESQLLMLAPFCPFVCEEIWERLGKKGLISVSQWPSADKNKINEELDANEELIEQTIKDIQAVLKLVKMEKPNKIKLFVSLPWKYGLFKELMKIGKQTKNPGEVLKKVMAVESLRKHGKEISGFVPKMVGSGKLPLRVSTMEKEFAALEEAKDFLSREFNNSEIEIIKAEDTQEPKAKNAVPGKVAILVE